MANQKKISKTDNPLVRQYGDFIREQHSTKRGSSEREDVRQEAVLRALAVDDTSSIRAPLQYFMRIVRNIFIDRQRRSGREAAIHKYFELTETGRHDQLTPERIVSAKQELEHVATAISLLPPRCRQAFLLHRFENLSYSAIARRMGISSGTVEKHIAEAMLRIARAANRADGDGR